MLGASMEPPPSAISGLTGRAVGGRKLIAVAHIDMVGYSRLIGLDDTDTIARLQTLRRILIDPAVDEHGGRIVQTAGDSLLIVFDSIDGAVRCMVKVQRLVPNYDGDVPPQQRIRFRTGINIGDVIAAGTDLHGDGVNVAVRLQTECPEGGVCVSQAVRDHVHDRLNLVFEELGSLTLKNISRPVRAFVMREIERPMDGDTTPRENMVRPAAIATDLGPPRLGLSLPDKPSVAVLPFQNMSGDPEQEYFADGMVEEIITALSRIRWLFVIARNSSFTYKGRTVDIKQVGRELGVRYVLEGSVRKGGNRVRIAAQLIDAIAGTHVWADRYDRDLSDIFAVQDEITASVAGAIEPALADAEQQRVMRKPPKSLDAWEAYQRGLWHFNKFAPEENQIGLGFFRQAIGLDPDFAPGHHGYALALQWDIWHFSMRPFSEVQGTPRDEARIGVSLDDKDAMAHAVLAHMRMWDSEWEAAISEARTALALNPNSAFVISMLGCVLGFGGYRDEALDRLRQAMRASPHDPLTWLWTRWSAVIQFYSRRFDAALETFKELVRLRPESGPNHVYIAGSLAFLGRLPEARAVLERAGLELPDPRWQQRPPWIRPEDYALWSEGLRLAAGETP
jgi:adenylate cyclase